MSQQRGEAPAPPQPEGLRGFWPGCFVARRSKTTAGIFPPRAAHPAKIRSSAAIRASDLVLSPTNPLFPHRVKLGKFSAMNPIAWFREKGRQLLQLKDTNHAIALGTAIG